MSQLLGVTKNTYLQTVRQPVYGIIVLVTLGGLALAPSLTGWTLDDDNKLLRDIGLSTLLVQGLFLAAFGASAGIHAEVEDRTVLTVAAKPVRRAVFVLGKYFGVLAAIFTAWYLAGLAYYMVMRHGVLQTAVETSDPTVLILGLGGMTLVLIAAAVGNYVYDWRFLPTVVTLALPVLTLGAAVMLVVDRDWKMNPWEVTQTMDDLPSEVAEALAHPGGDESAFNGLIEFRPIEGDQEIQGHRGVLVRKGWNGPLSEQDREFLEGLSSSLRWKGDVAFLVDSSRKLQGVDIFKASVLVLAALAVLASIAVAASTRLGAMSTFLVCLVFLGAGLLADQARTKRQETRIKSIESDVAARPGDTGTGFKESAFDSTTVSKAAGFLPQFQFFWMIDALSDDRVIPWKYLAACMGYAALCSGAFLALGMGLFETREVG